MIAESKLSRLILVSPWTLLIFLVIPLLVILSITLHVRIPLVGSTAPLLVNNIGFALLVACRLLRYLAGMRKTIRYGSSYGRPHQSALLSLPVAELRSQLGKTGYKFEDSGHYAEQRDTGYIGTTLMYFGLCILLSVGIWDNLRQFSGVLRDGMGPSTYLSKADSFLRVSK